MIAIEIDKGKLKELRKAVDKAGKSFPREFAAAINKTATATRTSKMGISQKIREELVVKAGDLNPLIEIDRRASPSRLTARVRLEKTSRLSLKWFKPNHIAAGVSYRISKTAGRNTVYGAFMGPKPGQLAPKLYGGVYKRSGGAKVKASKGRYVGKMREPIVKLMGPSPWGVFVKNRMSIRQVKDIREMLTKQMDRRIRENILRANGIIPSRKS